MGVRVFRRFILLQVVIWSFLCGFGVILSSASELVSGENLYSLVGNGSSGPSGDQLTGEIRGRINDQITGAALADIPVFAKQTSSFSVQLLGDSSRGLSKIKIFNTEIYQTITETDGTYALSELPTGVYIVWAYEKNGPYLKESYKGPQNQTLEKLLFVQGGSVVEIINFSLGKGAKVTGTVMSNLGGQGINSTLITVLNSKSKKLVSSAYTDPEGKFEVLGVPSGDYIVKAENEAFVDSYYGGDEKPSSASTLTVQSQGNVTGVDFLLKRSASVTGIVKDFDNQGLTKIKVSIFDYEGQTIPKKALKSVQTDQNGTFVIDKLPPGVYVIEAEASAIYSSALYDIEDQVEGPTSIVLDDSQVLAGIDVVLEVGGEIKGQIHNGNTGSPAQKVQVKVLDADTGDSFGQASTDNNGEYAIDRLPPGSYLIQTNSKSYKTKYFDNTTTEENATVVNLLAGSVLENINFTLVEDIPEQYPGSIAGNITWGYDQSAVKGACIKASTISPNKLKGKGCSDKDGGYKVADLPDGEYRLFVEKIFEYIPEFYKNIDITNPDDATPISVINGGAAEGINFVLAKVGNVTGTIFRDFDMQEIATYEIIAAPGTYRVKVISKGSGYVSPEEAGDEKDVTIYDGQTTTGINFALSVDGSLVGDQ